MKEVSRGTAAVACLLDELNQAYFELRVAD